VEYRRELARTQAALGKLRFIAKDLDRAVEGYTDAAKQQAKLVADFPDQADLSIDLARTHVNLGQVLGARGSADREEQEYRAAIKVLQEAKERPPLPRGWLGLMVDAHHNLAAVLREGEKWARAAEALRAAIRYQRAVYEDNRKDAGAGQRLASYYTGLLEVLAAQKDHAAAGKCAADFGSFLKEAGPLSWREPLRAAEQLARCVTWASEDKALPVGKRQELARVHGDRAMELLRAAVSGGFRDAGQLRSSAALQSLAEREDFRKLLRELGGKE
jgi:tetratricopeptide (TPR) repeat protein